MLDADGFVSAGWVHELGLNKYTHGSGDRLLMKGKVEHTIINIASSLTDLDKALPKSICFFTNTMGGYRQ